MAKENRPETQVSQPDGGRPGRVADGEVPGQWSGEQWSGEQCVIRQRSGDGSETVPETVAPRRVMILMSPKAGTGLGRDQLPKLIEQLHQADIAANATDKIEDLREFSRVAQQDAIGENLVVAAGGDGTLSLVAENVFPQMPLVPMPFGTENLLAKHFHYTSDAQQVFHTICGGRSYWLDAGRANGKLFLVMATCGFDAEVVRALHLTRKGHISRLSYAKPIFRALWRYRFPTLRVVTEDRRRSDATDADQLQDDMNGGEKNTRSEDECRWAMAFNLPKYGGDLSIEPDAIGNDGRLDLILFRRGSLWSGLRYVLGIKAGIHRRFSDVVRFTGKNVRISSDQRVPYQLDGDYAGHLPLAIETLPARIHLRLPVSP